ncbi:TPA: hypothetical protein N0F65_011110 [Lagenidium giganteum]|uniref:CS domain-containing protein n=1 Tax=Lagenidium giganteum TaxID=4803 RepID=A0AAV2ZHH8_9STRA|nr:TPA: hypothetical protein N0F65_011110 [Lagenidium giganteum]
MAAPGEHDQLLMALTARHQSIEALLDTFFEFLHRKTDLYVVTKDPALRKMGFLPGEAERRVLAAFRKLPLKPIDVDARDAAHATTTATATASAKPKAKPASKPKAAAKPQQLQQQSTVKHTSQPPATLKLTKEGKQLPVGNGGWTPRYTWTQSLQDVTMQVEVPAGTRARDVTCKFTATSLRVALRNAGCGDNGSEQDNVLVEGEFYERIRVDESLWSLDSGNHVLQVSLDKTRKTWWASALKGDNEIDTSQVDSTQPIDEYDETTQGAIRKAMYEQTQAQMNGHGRSEDQRLEQAMAMAQGTPGSPFSMDTLQRELNR